MAGEWIECKLADVCKSIDYGLTASASDQDGGPKFLRITDIVPGYIDWKTVPHVVADDATTAKYRLYDGDIVLARTGASTGTAAYVKYPPSAVFASYLVRLKVKSNFNPRFLAYYLKSGVFWTYIRGVLGDKSAQPNASASTMTKAPLRAPRNLDEQHAIAHILGTLDDKIDVNRRTSATLEAMARALFKSWFVDFEPVRAKAEGRDPGLPPHLAALFPDRLAETEQGEIPEGWAVRTVEDVMTLVYGKALKANERVDGPIPVYGSGGVTGYHNEALVDGPSIIVGRKGTVGSLHWEDRPFFPIDTVFYVRPKAPLTFCFYQLQMLGLEAMNTDAAVPGLNRNNVYRLPVPFGPDAVHGCFNEVVLGYRRRMRASGDETETLAALRDTLLPKLISGELRVKDAETFLDRVL